jgi:hypothetical protein
MKFLRLPRHAGVWTPVATLLLLVIAGCAPLNMYQFGTRSLYPADIQTVYVPIFESDSFRRFLGEQLS